MGGVPPRNYRATFGYVQFRLGKRRSAVPVLFALNALKKLLQEVEKPSPAKPEK
jgi:hypothetical protein